MSEVWIAIAAMTVISFAIKAVGPVSGGATCRRGPTA